MNNADLVTEEHAEVSLTLISEQACIVANNFLATHARSKCQ